jgi:hypothetical protein
MVVVSYLGFFDPDGLRWTKSGGLANQHDERVGRRRIDQYDNAILFALIKYGGDRPDALSGSDASCLINSYS